MSRSASHRSPTAVASAAIALLATGVLLVAGPTTAVAQESSDATAGSSYAPAPGEPTLEEMRTSFARYKDVEVALAEGYIQDPAGMCVTAEMEGRPAEEGGMGIHYFRPDLLGITATQPRVTGTGTHTDFRQPAILVYEPQADGSVELVAVENLVFEEAWRAAGHDEPPTFHGRPYDHMADDPATPDVDEAHGFAAHFDQHVYLFRENPLGVLYPFNPRVSCEHVAAVVGGDEGAGGH